MALSDTQTKEFDAVVIGAGFAGMYQLYRLRELGLSTQVYEAGEGVGGTVEDQRDRSARAPTWASRARASQTCS
jgi:cation diffusion facilitator CzcD-associated flavoprotein CzcO